MTTSRRRAPFLAVLLAATLALSALAAPPSAVAADASLTFTAADVLATYYVSAPDLGALLQAALGGPRVALARVGVSTTLDDLPTGSEADVRAAFQDRYDRAAAAVAGRVSEQDLQYAAIDAMARSLGDSHTRFLPPPLVADLVSRETGPPDILGTGILLLSKDGRVYVRHVLPGSPAELAGLRELDRLIAIDGQPVEETPERNLGALFAEPEGSTLKVTVRRAGTDQPLTFQVTRTRIPGTSVLSKVLPGGVAVVTVLSFVGGTTGRFVAALRAVQQSGTRALIIDLRHNPGGLVAEVLGVAGTLLPVGTIVMEVHTRQGRERRITMGTSVVDPALPLAVLVNERSASGSETLAAALQEHQRAKIIGTRTAGAVTVARLARLPDGSGLFVTTERVVTFLGKVLEGAGLVPDVEVDLTIETLDRGIDLQLERALEVTVGALAATP